MKREIVGDMIIDVLKGKELELLQVQGGLKGEGYDVSWETVGRHLKRMINENKITRRTGPRPEYQRWYDETGSRPWVYYYSLKDSEQEK